MAHSSIETVMSNPRLPQEITDYIVDFLQNEPGALRQCCLVSRSWVSRTRKYLFGTVRFKTSADLAVWKRAFSNPLNSPAYYTHCLGISCAKVIASVPEEHGWIQSFSNVVRLEIWACTRDLHPPSPLRPLTILKFLSIVFEILLPSQVFNLICSLPFLEDLDVTSYKVGSDDNDSAVIQALASPPLTGTLELCWARGIESIARRLLGLPNGLHFRILDCTWYLEDDLQWIKALVEGCADTLQYVRVERRAFGEFHLFGFYHKISTQLDLLLR